MAHGVSTARRRSISALAPSGTASHPHAPGILFFSRPSTTTSLRTWVNSSKHGHFQASGKLAWLVQSGVGLCSCSGSCILTIQSHPRSFSSMAFLREHSPLMRVSTSLSSSLLYQYDEELSLAAPRCILLYAINLSGNYIAFATVKIHLLDFKTHPIRQFQNLGVNDFCRTVTCQ